jgi:hypothetical protein
MKFDSAWKTLSRAVAVYFRHLPFLAAVTLVVFAPFKFAGNLFLEAIEVPTSGVASYVLDGAGTYILMALVTPAAVCGLLARMREGRAAGLGECLRWGRRQWGRTLWNGFKADVTVALYSALLVVPGLMKMTQLIFTQMVVAVEGDDAAWPLERSAEIGAGHRWRIFFVLFPLGVLNLAATFGVLQMVRGPGFGWTAVAALACLEAVAEQLGTVAILLMYLGLAERGAGETRR